MNPEYAAHTGDVGEGGPAPSKDELGQHACTPPTCTRWGWQGRCSATGPRLPSTASILNPSLSLLILPTPRLWWFPDPRTWRMHRVHCTGRPTLSADAADCTFQGCPLCCSLACSNNNTATILKGFLKREMHVSRRHKKAAPLHCLAPLSELCKGQLSIFSFSSQAAFALLLCKI